MYPKIAFEILPLQDGTYVLRTYTISVVSIGAVGFPEGRTMTSMKAYVNMNSLIADLKALLAA